MSKDVILDKYARLYEIPNQLALLGHQVESFCLSYQAHDEGDWDESNHLKSLVWHSKSYKGLNKIGLLTYPIFLLQKLKKFQPDIIIAASDIPHIVWGAWCAKKLNIPLVADLYDNFEAYGQAKIPFLKPLFHQALSTAKVISTTSFSLAEKMRKDFPNVPNIYPMPSVIDKDLFKSSDKIVARKFLNLPLDKPLIGTAGGLTQMKGIDDLFNAWEIIKNQNDQVYLILAGPTEEKTPLPHDERVIYLGLLSHKDVVTLFQALDVGVLCIPDDEFGRYCFPQKAYEMLACNLSIVSSEIGDMRVLLNKHSDSLYINRNYQDLANKLSFQLAHHDKIEIPILSWRQTVENLECYLKQLI
ncbi:glycosyltransferase family 4 protein [Acinetobacter wuhouensis]|uniref:glycosyltransferase family 4 protein n=1 Tax=Acinetobacter wuhouensis TaxID=1879050 RepID=UPI000AE5DAAE|nr:glycosyltransferase family 4 protein [Acinetobacter wuhouensis]